MYAYAEYLVEYAMLASKHAVLASRHAMLAPEHALSASQHAVFASKTTPEIRAHQEVGQRVRVSRTPGQIYHFSLGIASYAISASQYAVLASSRAMLSSEHAILASKPTPKIASAHQEVGQRVRVRRIPGGTCYISLGIASP